MAKPPGLSIWKLRVRIPHSISRVTQLVECRSFKPEVAGSKPAAGTAAERNGRCAAGLWPLCKWIRPPPVAFRSVTRADGTFTFVVKVRGASPWSVAQLGERGALIAQVGGSNPSGPVYTIRDFGNRTLTVDDSPV